MYVCSSFARLTTCIEEKVERGTVRRVLESEADIAEIKDTLTKISARIEAFLVIVLLLILLQLVLMPSRSMRALSAWNLLYTTFSRYAAD